MSDKARNLRLKTVFLFLVTCTPGTAVCARDALDIFLAPVRTRTNLPYWRTAVYASGCPHSRVARCVWSLRDAHRWVTHYRDPYLHPDPVVTDDPSLPDTETSAQKCVMTCELYVHSRIAEMAGIV